MKIFRSNGVIAAGILVGAVFAAVLLVVLRPAPPRAPEPDRTPIVSAERAEAVQGALIVRGSGSVRPRGQIELAAQVAGRIEWVSPSFVSGGRVRQGDVLVQLERADYDNAVRQARAQVAQDEVTLLQAEEEARIARREYEQFIARRPDLAAVDTVSARLALREPQRAAAAAALERSRAQLADAELALERTELKAPFDAVIRSESADIGGFAATGQSLATLFTSEVVEVVVPLTDADAALIPGLWTAQGAVAAIPARVVVVAGGQRYEWQGVVDRAEAALDEQSRTLDVIVRVDNPFTPGQPSVGSEGPAGPPLLVGQFVEVEIEGREGTYLKVPRRAVRTGDEVWVIEPEAAAAGAGEASTDGLSRGAIRLVPVTVIQRTEGDAYVVADLAAGEPVVTDGISLATPGMRVRFASEPGGGQ